jgi:hypothetical protein
LKSPELSENVAGRITGRPILKKGRCAIKQQQQR